MTALATPRVRRLDCYKMTWQSVTRRLEDMYSRKSGIVGDRDIAVVPAANPANIERGLQQRDMKFDLPVVAITPSATEPNANSYNAAVMRRYGQKTVISDDRSTWTVASLVPIVTTYTVTFLTDDIVTLGRMIDLWTSREIWGLRIDAFGDGVVVLKIKVIPDKTFSIVPPAPDSGGSDKFVQSTSLRVDTYSGYAWSVPSVAATQFDIGLITPVNTSRLEDSEYDYSDPIITIDVPAPTHEVVL